LVPGFTFSVSWIVGSIRQNTFSWSAAKTIVEKIAGKIQKKIVRVETAVEKP
jgi:hypothetical protein